MIIADLTYDANIWSIEAENKEEEKILAKFAQKLREKQIKKLNIISTNSKNGKPTATNTIIIYL